MPELKHPIIIGGKYFHWNKRIGERAAVGAVIADNMEEAEKKVTEYLKSLFPEKYDGSLPIIKTGLVLQ